MALVFALGGASACDGPTALGTIAARDAGVVADAGTGSRADAGVSLDAGVRRSDAGEAVRGVDDAGSDVDAGQAQDDAGITVNDAGEEECIVDTPGEPHDCEPDDDFCDPYGDTPLAQVDILEAWSHVDDGSLILDLRFAAPPFTVKREQIAIALEEDDDDTNDQLTEIACTEDINLAQGTGRSDIQGDRGFVLSNWPNIYSPPALYPPFVWETRFAGDPTVNLDRCADVEIATADPRVLRLHLAGNFPYSPSRRYRVDAVDERAPPIQVYCDTSPAGFDDVESLGGEPDGLVFKSICDAECPVDAGP